MPDWFLDLSWKQRLLFIASIVVLIICAVLFLNQLRLTVRLNQFLTLPTDPPSVLWQDSAEKP